MYVNLNELMKEKGINVSELSRATGISRPSIMRMKEKRSEGIWFKTLLTLMKYFDVSIDQLITVEK